MSGLDEKLLPCPFCAGKAITLKDHKKLGVYVACENCFVASKTSTQAEAIAAWNRRASGTPADVGELRLKLGGVNTPVMRGDNISIVLASYFEPGIESDELDDSGTWKQGAIDAVDEILDAVHAHYATALERVVRERDEARATLDEVCLSNRQEWQRATSAEAKLAEARKVIEELRVASEAFLALAEDGSRLHKAHSTSGRFLEETK